MESLSKYINQSIVMESGLISYDGTKHITGVDFSTLPDIRDSNIIAEINSADLDMMISPEEEEFDYQWMNIYWDKNLIEFYMPNNFTNGAPMGFRFKVKIDSAAMNRWMKNGSDWQPGDFSLYHVPGTLVAVASNTGMDISVFKTQLCTLIAIVMNHQPEPLW